jgi:hypothetical protein
MQFFFYSPIRFMIVKNSGNNFLSSDWLISVLPVGFLIPSATSAIDLPAGSAKGSLTYDGATAELKFAAASLSIKKMSASPLFS